MMSFFLEESEALIELLRQKKLKISAYAFFLAGKVATKKLWVYKILEA